MYTETMKKTIITSFLAVIFISGSAFAQTSTDLTASSQKPEEVKLVKPEAVLTKKQKIEAELRSTISKLDSVIVRTQNLIDLLTKNGKSTSNANELLDLAKTSLVEATEALDQFSGVVKEKESPEEKALPKIMATKEVTPIKDPLKKTQDSLKASKASLIESIKSLKEGLSEENGEQ
jgi:hypothetical protein